MVNLEKVSPLLSQPTVDPCIERRGLFIKTGLAGLIRLGGLVALFFLLGFSRELRAESATSGLLVSQDVPGSNQKVQSAGSAAGQSQSYASVSGTVRDARGDVFPDVPVALVARDDTTVDRVTTTDNKGAFTFAELPPATYHVKISVAGLEPFTSDPLLLAGGERRELPVIAMPIARKTTTVDVVATRSQVAQAQVGQQEKQRVLGFLPNYYTSYIWNAAPMTPKLKFHLSLRAATDPVTFLVVGGIAGVEQAHKTFPGYGQGFEGYAKRFGATYADVVIGRMLSKAILPAVLHQDPRYFYRGSGTIRSRILYALEFAVICRGDNGRLQPNYSVVLGSFAAAGLSNLYRTSEDRQAGLTFRNGLIIIGSGAVQNVMREFFSRKLTPNVPAFANGKP